MTIIHPIDDFLFELFPDLKGAPDNIQRITESLQDFYTVGPFQPKVVVEKGIATVNINTQTISTQKKEYEKVVAWAEQRRYAEAKRGLSNLIKANPGNSEFHRILGQILSDEGDAEGAVNHLIDALRWNPRNGFALIMMGNIFAKFKNDIDTAMIYYNQAVKLNPKDHIAFNNIGANLMQMGKTEEGKIFLEKAIAINPDYPNTLYGMGLSAERQGDYHTAFDWAIKALKKSKTADPIYRESISLATEISRRIADLPAIGGGGHEAYIKRLEVASGLSIRIDDQTEIPTAAKIEFAENYGRDYHQIRLNRKYPAAEHLLMHELVHLDLVVEARKAQVNQLFISRPQHKELFIRHLSPFIHEMNKQGYPDQQIANYVSALFEGLNRQVYNAPVDLFIEDFLFREFPNLRPLQFTSLLQIVQEGIHAVTDKRIVSLSPRDILSKSKIMNMVAGMQLKMLYGVDLMGKYEAGMPEKKAADRMFEEFLEYRPDRKPGEEYEMVQHWAEDLHLSQYFELVDEISYRKQQGIDDISQSFAELENDPFDLDKPDKPDSEPVSMEDEPAGKMAVVFHCLSALEWFEGKNQQQIQDVAFEIGMLGRTGINPGNTEQKYHLASVPGKTFSSLQVLAWMYVGFQLLDPGLDTGLHFSGEYQMALAMHKPKL